MMGQDTFRHMMVPTKPRANHIITHSQIVFPILNGGLYRPAHFRDAHQFATRRIHWSDTKIGFEFRFLSQGTTYNQPNLTTRQFSAHFDDSPKSKLGYHRSLTALLDQVRCPLFCRDLRCNSIHLLRRRSSFRHPLLGRSSPLTTPFRDRCLGTHFPHLSVVRNLGVIPQAQQRSKHPLEPTRLSAQVFEASWRRGWVRERWRLVQPAAPCIPDTGSVSRRFRNILAVSPEIHSGETGLCLSWRA
jgi:hypothetical protein